MYMEIQAKVSCNLMRLGNTKISHVTTPLEHE